MSESKFTQSDSPALYDLARMVEISDGLDAQEHFLQTYAPDAYPTLSDDFDEISAVRELAESLNELSEEDGQATAKVIGRVASLRVHARYAFMDIQDTAGTTIQLIVPRPKKSLENTDPEQVDTFLKHTKYGDILVANGTVAQSRSGEPSIIIEDLPLRAASAFITPDKVGSATTAEERNQRIARFRARATMKATIRTLLEADGYLETITPVLSDVPSGANAEVFTSHIDSLDRSAYLRISPELALKTAIINGYSDKVYEFATNFRNEGIDREHSPEFEMLEFYSAYTTAAELRDFTAKVVGEAIVNSLKSPLVNIEKEDGSSVTVDLSQWAQADYAGLIREATDIDLDTALQLDAKALKITLLSFIAEKFGDDRAKSYEQLGAASLIDKLFKLTCRPYINEPTFVERYPAIMVPLARPNDANSDYVDMFQGIVGSTEVIKGYQELNDPVLQLSNLYGQAQAKSEGDTEAMSVDWRYLEAMLRGLPPTAGCGIGIDRLAAIMNGTKNIHATMPYPFRERFVSSDAVERTVHSNNGSRT